MTSFAGVIPILATPFRDDESLDLDSWDRLLEFMVGLGVDGVTILGVLGESNRLADHERATLIERAVATSSAASRSLSAPVTAVRAPPNTCQRWRSSSAGDAVMVTPLKEPVPNDDRIVEAFQRFGSRLAIPIVLQDHPASSEVHMSAGLIARLLKSVPQIACVKEEAVPTAPKIRMVRDAVPDRPFTILTGLGALYAPFDLEAGSDGFNTGFAFPEVLVEMVKAARAADWARVHGLFAQFAALIVYEQQPGVAIRKELLRRRGLLASARARHPGATISAPAARQLESLLARTLPGVDVTRPLEIDRLVTVAG